MGLPGFRNIGLDWQMPFGLRRPRGRRRRINLYGVSIILKACDAKSGNAVALNETAPAQVFLD